MRHALALAVLLVAGPVAAQQMYRCGNTFSEQPCGPNAAVIPTQGVAQPGAAPDAARRAAIEADCRDWISRVPAWRDRDSIKIGTLARGEMQARNGRMLRAYHAMVNGKGAGGGYVGERPYVCFVDEQQARVVDLYQPGDLK